MHLIIQFLIVLCLTFVILYEPIIGYKYAKLCADKKGRPIYYGMTVAGILIPTLVILSIIGISDFSISDIGLSKPELTTSVLGYWISTICLFLGFSYFVLISILIVVYKFIPPLRDLIVSFQINRLKKGSSPFEKGNTYDRHLWICSTLTVNMLKELLYKGVLIFFILILVPHTTIWVAIILSSILYAFSKAYMGFQTVLANSFSGVISCVIAISMNSVLTLMLFHFLLVYFGKLNFEQIQKKM